MSNKREIQKIAREIMQIKSKIGKTPVLAVNAKSVFVEFFSEKLIQFLVKVMGEERKDLSIPFGHTAKGFELEYETDYVDDLKGLKIDMGNALSGSGVGQFMELKGVKKSKDGTSLMIGFVLK